MRKKRTEPHEYHSTRARYFSNCGYFGPEPGGRLVDLIEPSKHIREKKSYRFEFQDDNGKDLGLEPLGLPEDSDWILYAGLDGDRTYMRNPFIYSLSRQIGRYASRMRFVELYLNTDGGTVSNANYHGVYSLGENLKRGDHRIDAERLDPSMASTPEIEGGYILKHDRPDPDGSGLFFAGGVGVQFVYPDDTDTNEKQRDCIREHLDEALTTDNFMEMIDPLAAVDHHMLNALAKNADAFRLSGYLHKPRDGKVTFGPIWDFDLSMDSLDSRDDDWDTWSGPPDASLYFEHDERVPYWSRWLENPDFLQLWIDRWFEHRRGPFATSNIQAMVDSMRDELTESAARDAARWNNSIWSGRVDNLRNWLSNRVEWIDDQWLEPVEFSRSGGPIPPGSLLTLQSSNGTIFFTRDGSDPRPPGGALSNIAETYVSPVTLNANARVVARSRNGMDEWSAARAETFVVETPPLVITEIHFHPTDPDISSIYKADDFEFIELFNRGTARSRQQVSVSGYPRRRRRTRNQPTVDCDFEPGGAHRHASGRPRQHTLTRAREDRSGRRAGSNHCQQHPHIRTPGRVQEDTHPRKRASGASSRVL